MFVFIEEFFITNDVPITGFHEKGIPFQVKPRSLPFMLQLISSNRNDCIAIGGTCIIDQLCHSVEVTPLNRTQLQT